MSPGQHLLDLSRLLVLASGPLPLGIVLGRTAGTQRAAPLAHGLLALLATWCVLQVAVGLILGVLKHFTLGGALVAETLLLLVGLGCGVRGFPVASRARQPRLTSIEQAFVMMAVVMGLGLLARAVSTPVTDVDSLAYHLPAMATWYQNGSLVELEGLGFVGRYPFGWEVLSALFVMPFREDFLVAAPNLVAWSIFGLSVHLVSMELGARRPQAVMAAVLVLAMPIVRKQVTTMHVDLALGAFFMAGLYLAITCSSTPFDVALLSAAIGMLVGVKTPGLVYALVIAVVAPIVRRTRADPSRADGAVAGGVVVAAALLVGTFWYARNALATGNPLGAVRVTLGGRTLLPGPLDPSYVRTTTLLHLFDPGDPRHWRIVLSQLWANLGLPFAVLAGLGCAWRPREPRRAAGLGLLLIATGLAYCATPFSGDNEGLYGKLTPWFGQGLRYALPFAGVVAVCGALGASTLQSAGAWLGATALLVALAGVANRTTGIAAAAVLVAWGAWTGAAGLAPRPKRLAHGVLAVALAAVVVGVSFRMRGARDAERVRTYGRIVTFIDTQLGATDTIGYTLTRRGYVLYGRALERRARWVPPPPGPSLEWVDSLRRRSVRLLAVGPIPERQKGKANVQWLDGPGAPFVKVYGRDSATETVLYRLVDGGERR